MGIAEGARPRPGRSPTTIPTTSRNSSPVVAPPSSSRAASISTSSSTRDNSEIVTESNDSLDDDLDAPRQAISTTSGWASAPGVDPALRPLARVSLLRESGRRGRRERNRRVWTRRVRLGRLGVSGLRRCRCRGRLRHRGRNAEGRHGMRARKLRRWKFCRCRELERSG